jgi:hypothetical protein
VTAAVLRAETGNDGSVGGEKGPVRQDLLSHFYPTQGGVLVNRI